MSMGISGVSFRLPRPFPFVEAAGFLALLPFGFVEDLTLVITDFPLAVLRRFAPGLSARSMGNDECRKSL